MQTTQARHGSASVQGDLWGARALDYSKFQEPQLRLLYEQAIGHAGIGHMVVGIDASHALVDIARERVPGAQFEIGDMQFLPYADESFDVVTGFNSFQYAADPVAALREAGRVARPGGTVHAVVWGREEHTELVAALRALRPLVPPAPPDAPGPFALSYAGARDALAERAGLTPTDAGYIEVTFEYPDQTALLKGNNSNGPVVLAERTSGEAAVVNSLRAALAPFRTATGAYRIETEWRYVTART
jgi:SAM-dependent methyltransferase